MVTLKGKILRSLCNKGIIINKLRMFRWSNWALETIRIIWNHSWVSTFFSVQASQPVSQMKRMNKWRLRGPGRGTNVDSTADSQFNGEEHVHIIAAKQLSCPVLVRPVPGSSCTQVYLYLYTSVCVCPPCVSLSTLSQLAWQAIVGLRSWFKWYWNWFHLNSNYNILFYFFVPALYKKVEIERDREKVGF